MKVKRVRAIAYRDHLIFPTDDAQLTLKKIGVVPFRVFLPRAAARLEEYAAARKVVIDKTEWIDVYRDHLVPSMLQEFPGLRVKGAKLLITSPDEKGLTEQHAMLRTIFRLYGFEVEASERTVAKKKRMLALLKIKFNPNMDTAEPRAVDARTLGQVRLGGHQLTVQRTARTSVTPAALHLRWASAIDKEVEIIWSYDTPYSEEGHEALREFAWALLNS